MTKRLLIRWAVVAASLVVATVVVPGISIQGNRAWLAVAVMAAILGLVNAFVRPILQFLSCGCIVATLGLFLFVVNAFTLWLSSWVAVNWLGVDFVVDGFWPALFGGIIVSIVSFVLNSLLVDRKR
ncbi:MAG: phage holin family protein [Thermoleophilia bacterium]|nr:phage holin family protein [Thermoleophilia bacterium]